MANLLPVLIFTGSCFSAARAAEFHVAPDGRDTHSGTAREPFATFHRAQEAVRAERARDPAGGGTVWFRDGAYRLDRPLRFEAVDSGDSAERPVRYMAESGARPVFSGGDLLSGWAPDPVQPGVWKTRVAVPGPDDDGRWRFEQLWLNGERAIRARSPNGRAFHSLQAVTEEAEPGSNRMKHAFSVAPEELAILHELDPAALADVQVLVFHKWDTTREWLVSVDSEAGQFTTRGGKMKSWNPMTRGSLYFLENFRAALEAPGEWFLDRDGWLYYYPRLGEDLARAEVVAPRLDAFITVQGQPDDAAGAVRFLDFLGPLTRTHLEQGANREPPRWTLLEADRIDGIRRLRTRYWVETDQEVEPCGCGANCGWPAGRRHGKLGGAI